MQRLAFIIAISVTAAAAQAAGDRSSRFACGINVGGQQFTSSFALDSKRQYNYRTYNPNSSRMNHVLGAVQPEPLSLNINPAQPTTASPSEKRLPPKLTFATLGCSWR